MSGVIPEHDVAEAVHAAVRSWIKADPRRQLLLLLDEADDFLDTDAHGNRFDNVERFRRLMLETERNVKVALAGLHRTARFESLPNQPLSHLGKPVSIGPLKPQHAFTWDKQFYCGSCAPSEAAPYEVELTKPGSSEAYSSGSDLAAVGLAQGPISGGLTWLFSKLFG